jgi:hypothetical protein
MSHFVYYALKEVPYAGQDVHIAKSSTETRCGMVGPHWRDLPDQIKPSMYSLCKKCLGIYPKSLWPAGQDTAPEQ